MTVLSNVDRQELWGAFMARLSGDRAAAPLSKTALRAAVDAADNWADANAANYNTALPEPARSALTAKQKAAVLMFVIDRRHGVL